MGLTRVATNVDAQYAYQEMLKVNQKVSETQLKLASGKAIRSTEDDPAGYQLARGLERRERGLAVALQNVSNAKSILSVAEGGYANIMDILQKIKEKATQAADQSLNDTQRAAIDDQVTALINEIGDIVDETTFNGFNLIDGNYTGDFQVGEEKTNTLTVALDSASAASLGINSIDVSSASGANDAIETVSDAIDTLASAMQTVGEYKSRLSVKENTLATAINNTQAVRSNIEDADMVKEQMNMLKYQILQQTSAASFAQSNSAPQLVLQILNS